MKITQYLCQEMYQILMKRKKVGGLNYTVEEFANWCHTVNSINTLEMDDTQYAGIDLAKWKVPTFMKDFFLPNSVKYSSLVKELDYLVRPSEDVTVSWELTQITRDNKKDETKTYELQILGLSDFNDITIAILGGFRQDGETAISDIRTDLTLESVKSRACFGNKCQQLDIPLVPLELSIALYKPSVYSEDVNEIVVQAFQEACKFKPSNVTA